MVAATPNKSIVVGIDPGMTTGVSVLDTNGKIIAVTSKRNFDTSEIIKFVYERGRPVLIASDVSYAPRSARKIASSFGARLFEPDQSMTVREKHELTKEFRDNFQNRHEMDALAASVKAWKKYRSLFTRIDDALRMFGIEDAREKAVMELMTAEGGNISSAIRKISAKYGRGF